LALLHAHSAAVVAKDRTHLVVRMLFAASEAWAVSDKGLKQVIEYLILLSHTVNLFLAIFSFFVSLYKLLELLWHLKYIQNLLLHLKH
jgi:hypothetical protein